MKEHVRYRVTGSLFLLAMAVIGLPMLLDGSGLPAKRLPDLPMQDTLPEVQPLENRAPESDFVARVEQLRRQVDEDGFLTGSGTRFGEPVLGRPGGSDSAPAPETAAPAEDQAGMNAPGEVPPAPGGARHRQTGTDAWAVQVASFSRAGNAEAFRARLRQDGYEAFISSARLNQAVLSRVAVGPLLDRQRAETLRGELSARYDVQARLVTFSN